jgi:hypothetical protein
VPQVPRGGRRRRGCRRPQPYKDQVPCVRRPAPAA